MPDAAGGNDAAGDRVLMLAPTARDAAMARSVLADSGFTAEVFEAFEELAHALEGGAGVVVLMEEFFASEDAGHLLDALGRQPAWSNLPLIVLAAGKGRLARAEAVMRAFGNVVLLDRPARIAPLVSAIRAALAARRRQYEIRDHLEQIKQCRGAGAAPQGRRGGQGRGRGGQPHEGRVPGHPLARAADAAQRHRRLGAGSSAPARSTPRTCEEGLAAIERNSPRSRPSSSRTCSTSPGSSRATSGSTSSGCSLAEVIEAALAAVMPAADAKGIRIHKVLDSLAGPVTGDAARLQQVVWNLLSNAVKFTPKGGKVQVLLERVNSHVEISVIDTGMGIQPEFLPHVFDRFRQADASTTRRHGGLGLGLAIVKQLVEMHGGSSPGQEPRRGPGGDLHRDAADHGRPPRAAGAGEGPARGSRRDGG